MTNQQQHGVEIVYQKKGEYLMIKHNNSNHKATTTWESGSKYLNDNYIYKMPFIYIYSDGVMPHQQW